MPERGTRRPITWAVLALTSVLVIAGCAGPLTIDPVATTAEDGRGAIRPLPAPTDCDTTVTDADGMSDAMDDAKAGDRICLIGNFGTRRLQLENSGTEDQPIEIVGDGHTIVRGISIEASNVEVSGINAVRGFAPGIELIGNNIKLENSTSIDPEGGDRDGLRFFGNDITISHNTIRNTLNFDLAHADCMQTFATDEENGPSKHVLIANNRCENVENMCLMAEGPHSLAGDGIGEGESNNFVFSNNYCDVHASQATEVDDIQNAKFTHNVVVSSPEKAWAFQNKATGGVVSGNLISPETDYEVGMDDSSRPNYKGPEPGGKP